MGYNYGKNTKSMGTQFMAILSGKINSFSRMRSGGFSFYVGSLWVFANVRSRSRAFAAVLDEVAMAVPIASAA